MDSEPSPVSGFTKPWVYFAWAGVAVSALSALGRDWGDALGYGIATAGMFAGARRDFAARTWPKLAALGCAAAAVAVWVLW